VEGFIVNQAEFIRPFAGTSSPAHLEENVAAGSLRLEPADLAALDALAGVSPSGR